jgi:gluconolactonase
LKTGSVELLYSHVDGRRLSAPNDIVFDKTGGFWFTDRGQFRPREYDRGGVCYAMADGSRIEEVIFPLMTPNGIALSPDERTLYVAETQTGRVWSFDVTAPGKIDKQKWPSPNGGTLLAGLPGYQMLDSMKVDSDGNVCVATLANGGITVISPDGSSLEHIALPDPSTTNACFGGPDLQTIYVTLGSTGRLMAGRWPRRGHPLNYNAYQ